MHYTAIQSLLLILSRFIGLPRFSYLPFTNTPQNYTPHLTLKLYSNFKNNVFLEENLNDIKDIKYRQALAKIRISAHSLQIEKGRYCRQVIPREQRILYRNFVQKMHVMMKVTF